MKVNTRRRKESVVNFAVNATNRIRVYRMILSTGAGESEETQR
jgi:hypothetical protein